MPPSDRRVFLRTLAGGITATAFLPGPTHAAPRPRRPMSPLPSEADPRDEAVWRLVKEQFPLRDDLALMNAANLCPAPYPVIDAVERLGRDVDRDASFQNRAKFAQLKEASRSKVAAYLGADSREIALTRNTSEGNNTVVNGLDLGPGDEVVIWDQNHPTNNVAWDVRARRAGFRVTRVTTPPQPTSPGQLLTAFADALSPSTRVLAFSHVSNVSGVALPARELCRLAQERGILTLIDGAQTCGAIQLDVHALECDFYTASAHKWLVGPKETGLLYVRADRVGQLWPSDVGVGWEQAIERGAEKFENLGQRDDAAVAALATAVTFHEILGVATVEQRVRYLAASLKQMLAERIPGVRFHTPDAAELSAGVVVFTVPGTAARAVFEGLYAQHGIAGAAMGGAFEGVRLSPHMYNTLAEVDRAVAAVAELTG